MESAETGKLMYVGGKADLERHKIYDVEVYETEDGRIYVKVDQPSKVLEYKNSTEMEKAWAYPSSKPGVALFEIHLINGETIFAADMECKNSEIRGVRPRAVWIVRSITGESLAILSDKILYVATTEGRFDF